MARIVWIPLVLALATACGGGGGGGDGGGGCGAEWTTTVLLRFSGPGGCPPAGYGALVFLDDATKTRETFYERFGSKS